MRVTCNTGNSRVFQVYNYTQRWAWLTVGLHRLTSSGPYWKGLQMKEGRFTWDNSGANRNQKKQKQELKKIFQKFFGIYDSDPFEDYKDHKNRVCYRAKFYISPDE